jgi:predicted aspartyl protease
MGPQTTASPTKNLKGENIALVKTAGVYRLPVEINGVITREFILDTGATDVNIPVDVALTLMRSGTIQETDFLPDGAYTLADGSTANSPRFLLRSLKIGNRRIANVVASIGPRPSKLLLVHNHATFLGMTRCASPAEP